MLFSESEELEDITDTIIFEDEPSIFTEKYAVELVETAIYLMYEYTENNSYIISEFNFKEILFEEIKEIFYVQMENHIDDLDIGDDIEDDMNDLLEEALNIFITIFHPDKSLDNKDKIIDYKILNASEINLIEKKIQKLREIPQPIQRSSEWYKFRWNLITASNAYKAFETQSSINQLIYEKCQPLKTYDEDQNKIVNTNSALHWGQKYEPLSVMIHEEKYKTKIEDFGCIKHSAYNFLGASPDGIVVNQDSDRYGRMIEIKNPVSREINGIPKKEYWIQMQLQMEVCDLDECDFLETKFTEYFDYASFKDDIINDNCDEDINLCLSKDNKMKGLIIYFYTPGKKPFYAYKPLNIVYNNDINNWIETTIDYYTLNPQFNYIYITKIYWKLNVFSCVLVLRKKDWFKNNIKQLEQIWNIVEQERITGYSHRAPVKKNQTKSHKLFFEEESQGCLIDFDKVIKIE